MQGVIIGFATHDAGWFVLCTNFSGTADHGATEG
jgi:hypothetical protein